MGVLEAGGGVDSTKTAIDNDGRLTKNLNFVNAAIVVNVDPVGAPANSDHATVVADVTASNNGTYLGVANQSNIYMAAFGATSGLQADSDKSMVAALSYYYRQYGVAQFNMSFFSRLTSNSDTESHPGVIMKLNAAASSRWRNKFSA